MSDALTYNILNKMYKLMLFTSDAPDPVKIKSYKINIRYQDINYGKRVEIPVASLPERSVILDAFMNVTEAFSDGGTFYPTFGVGFSADSGSTLNNFRIFSPSDSILASTGVKTPDGSAFNRDTAYSRLLNYSEDDLVVFFYSPGVWNTENLTNAKGTNNSNCRAYHAMAGNVLINGGTLDPEVLAVGGYNFEGTPSALNTARYSDIGPWALVADPLDAISCAPAAVGASGEAFIIGGSQGLFTGTMNGETYFFDGVNIAEISADLNVPRCALGAFYSKTSSTDYEIVSFGGRVNQSTNAVVATTEVYTGTNAAGSWAMGAPLLIPTANCGSTGDIYYGLCINGVDSNLNPVTFSQEYQNGTWSIGQGLNAPSFWVSADGTQFSTICLTETTLEEYDGNAWVNGPSYILGPTRGTGICGTQEAAVTLGGIDLNETHSLSENDLNEGSLYYTHYDPDYDLASLTGGSLNLFITLTYR